ncbi:MAG: tRNA (cytidine(56)-2'-O)-methyltransferase [Candidatus Aenigmatarchaeota archaeon]
MTTHCALTARALGADKMIYTGDHDKKMQENVDSVVKRWGGSFEIQYEENWKKYLKNYEGKKVYLAMFGLPVQDQIEAIRNYDEDLLVIVGGEKIPGEIYEHIDTQVAVTNQPHSEVAALAVFLDKLQKGSELEKKFEGASVEVLPKKQGKDIKEN